MFPRGNSGTSKKTKEYNWGFLCSPLYTEPKEYCSSAYQVFKTMAKETTAEENIETMVLDDRYPGIRTSKES